MNANAFASGCASCPLNRRRFLARSGAAALGLLSLPLGLQAAPAKGPIRIRVLYSLHGPKQERPDWPNKDFDFGPPMERITQALAKGCKGFEFIPSLASGPEQAEALLKADQAAGSIDGYLVYQMNCWNRVVQSVAASGKPVLYTDFQFGGSGGFLVYTAGFLRSQTPNVGFVASSNLKDLVKAVKCFQVLRQGGSVADFVAATAKVRRQATPKAGSPKVGADSLQCLEPQECLRRLKQTKLLAVRSPESGPAQERMGIEVLQLSFGELNEAWKAADKDESRAVAQRWQRSARQVVGVSEQTLEASAAMYLAQKAVMKKYGASGITINCLGGFYGGHLHAYPCLGFHELLNEGLVGGCECDVRSAATQLAGSILSQGRPGYISDPVLDTAKRQIIYAHCVASNRPLGPQAQANAFDILTHSEDRQGASVRSLLPVGQLVTTLQFEPSRKEILLHQAKTLANDPDDRACRTKLCAEPLGDIEKLFGQWDQWGWHRVTFYGDLKQPLYGLAEALGWKVLEEA